MGVRHLGHINYIQKKTHDNKCCVHHCGFKICNMQKNQDVNCLGFRACNIKIGCSLSF